MYRMKSSGRGISGLLFAVLALSNMVLGAHRHLGEPELQAPGRRYPFPECERCPSVTELQAPGIGISLETSHGTVVIRHHNGTYENVALIEGNKAYVDLLSTMPSDRRPRFPRTPWEKFEYSRRQAQRRLNKLLGRPATPETAVLAEMVADLRTAAQKALGDAQPITAAVLSAPDRMRLGREEVGDIFDYLKLKDLVPERWYGWYGLGGAVATYMGYGQGLCTHYIDEYRCEREQAQLRTEQVLHVSLNNQSLSGAIAQISYVRWGQAQTAFDDAGLGYHAVRDPLYWSMVTEEIRRFALYARGDSETSKDITAVILSGPRGDAGLKRAVEDALRDLLDDEEVHEKVHEEVHFFTEDDHPGSRELMNEKDRNTFNTFVTARGAAEMAKRMQEGPYECAQTAECRRRRMQAHGIMKYLQSVFHYQEPSERHQQAKLSLRI